MPLYKAPLTFLQIYPIGSIYISVGSASPATLFGGTWTAFGAGRALVGIDSTDTDFDAVEETRGAKTHTLTVPELPYHNHAGTADIILGQTLGSAYGTPTAGWAGATPNTGNSAYPFINYNTGEGHTHNNIQPSIVVRIWKRTA